MMPDLRDQFPEVFSEAFDVSVPEGWVRLTSRLIDRALASLNPEVRNTWRIYQAKEKFGELRIYHSGGEGVEDLVEEAAEESRRTCQLCGKPGKRRGGSWIAVLCDEDERKVRGQ